MIIVPVVERMEGKTVGRKGEGKSDGWLFGGGGGGCGYSLL